MCEEAKVRQQGDLPPAHKTPNGMSLKPQLIALSMLVGSALAATAFADAHATAPKLATPGQSMHTPMTMAQTHALWRAAQTKLKADHLYSGAINGEKTDDTVSAIRKFQSLHQLPQSGRLDLATRQALGI